MLSEERIINSFQMAKRDIYTLYEHVKVLKAEVELLREQNLALIKKRPKTRKVAKTAKRLVGSTTGSKFHEATCLFAKNIKSENWVEFSSKAQAKKKGYKPCTCVLT